jgi:hypothetical protein
VTAPTRKIAERLEPRGYTLPKHPSEWKWPPEAAGSIMAVATRKFQERLIRLAKGFIEAWEEWLKTQQ